MSVVGKLREEVGELVARFPEDVAEMRLRLEVHLEEHGLPTGLSGAGFTVGEVMDSMTNTIYRDAPALMEESGDGTLSVDVTELLLRLVRDSLVLATFVFEE